jgi:hypothetical protein
MAALSRRSSLDAHRAQLDDLVDRLFRAAR